MKNLLKLGNVLSKNEQKRINGGYVDCYSEFSSCDSRASTAAFAFGFQIACRVLVVNNNELRGFNRKVITSFKN